MINVINAFTIIAGIILIGYLAEVVFKRTMIPDVVFLMAVGILFNEVLGWFDPTNLGFGATLFATFALVYLLFQGSINLNFKSLFASLKGALSLTILSFIFTAGITTVISVFILQIDWGLALLLGFTVGGTSSAVVIPMVKNLPLDKKNTSILTVESAISDVLCIIGAVTVMTVLKTEELSGVNIVNSVVSSFIIAIFIGIVVGIVWILVLTKYKEFVDSEMVTVALIIALYALIESPFINASGAMAVLSFGLILGNSKPLLELLFAKKKEKDSEIVLKNVLSAKAKNFYSEISFFVKVFFFVYLGMLIDFSNPIVFLWGAIITIAIFLVRPLAVNIVFRNQKMNDINRTSLEVLIPKGLAAAVIVQLAIQEEILNADKLVMPVMAIIFISIIMTTLLIFLNNKKIFNGFLPLYKKIVSSIKREEKKE